MPKPNVENEKGNFFKAVRVFVSPQMPKREGLIQPVDRKKVITNSGLTRQELSLLKKYGAAGILSIDQFFKLLNEQPSLLDNSGYTLGLTNDMDMYVSISRALGFKTWMEAYKDFGLDTKGRAGSFTDDYYEPTLPPDHTDQFLHKITAEGKPIAFFIPNNVLRHSPDNITNVTRDEMVFS